MSQKSNEDINKKIDNELKKQELKAKYGGDFSHTEDISPELEGEWLQSVEKFEEQYHNAKKVKIWDYIGKPAYRKLSELSSNDLSVELDRLYQILDNNNISLDTLCEVEDNELYRFITEEFFFEEIDDVRVEGMTSCYTYEDYHPNAKYDIEQAFNYFIDFALGKSKNMDGTGYDLLYIDTENYKDTDENPITEQEVVKKINTFLDSFDYFDIHTTEIEKIDINKKETDAQLNFSIHYAGCYNNSVEKIDFKGKGIMKLKPSMYGGWSAYHINLPGLKVN